jgi:hypothetical protein
MANIKKIVLMKSSLLFKNIKKKKNRHFLDLDLTH